MTREDGIWISKFDADEEDEEGTIYHVKAGKTYTPEGAEWICYGGFWKRIGDLPKETL